MRYIKLYNDNWDDLNKVWEVLEYRPRTGSTAVHLVLEDTLTKNTIHRIVCAHEIEWLEAKDW